VGRRAVVRSGVGRHPQRGARLWLAPWGRSRVHGPPPAPAHQCLVGPGSAAHGSGGSALPPPCLVPPCRGSTPALDAPTQGLASGLVLRCSVASPPG
jgi:hypothetical protein